MYKFPDEIVEHFKKKYPNSPIDIIFHELMEQIICKCMIDNCCSIKGFGKFLMFKTFSNRTKKEVIRFKFIKSLSFMKNIYKDKFLLKNLPIHGNVPFTEANEDKCLNEHCIKARDSNLALVNSLTVKDTERSRNVRMKILIEDIINNM